MTQCLIDGDELLHIEHLLDTDIIQNSPEASFLLTQVLHDIQAMPEIAVETLPIVQQLRTQVQELTKSCNFWMNEYKEANRKLVKLCRICENCAVLQGAAPACDQCPIFEGVKNESK